jgi:hypothetical protein
MQPLNYCRQISKQFSRVLDIPSTAKESKEVLSHIVDLIKVSQKFMLPDGGIVCDDMELKALDESVPLRLPHPFIALEFSNHRVPGPGKFMPSKQVLLARERDEGDVIVITPVLFAEHKGVWMPWPEVAMDTTKYLDRANLKGGRVPVNIRNPNAKALGVPDDDYADEMAALLSFLNVLQCKNVHVEKVVPKKQGRCKTAFQFDTYHVLTVGGPMADCQQLGGSHRSPREHLRRGHVRRLQTGKTVWVNAALVSSGRGFGVVTKDYRVGV